MAPARLAWVAQSRVGRAVSCCSPGPRVCVPAPSFRSRHSSSEKITRCQHRGHGEAEGGDTGRDSVLRSSTQGQGVQTLLLQLWWPAVTE